MVSLSQLSAYYKNKKVFVTGHTGFKGAWLCTWLRMLGAQVKGYALAPEYRNGLFDIMQSVQPVEESVIADIRDKERLTKELFDFSPDYIFHLAAQPLVRRSYLLPAETFEVNVVGTANLLEALRHHAGKCQVVIITTDKVYENSETDVLYKEDDRLGGYDPYSASKACTEMVVSSFRNSFFHKNGINEHGKVMVTARAGNVIGGGDRSQDRIIPDIVRALENNLAITVRNPSSVRPWQHVLEPIGGYLILGALISEKPTSFSSAYNFGPFPDDHLQVKHLVETAIKSWGSGKWIDISDATQPHEAQLLKLDISKARSELNWSPKLNAASAIDWTIRWFREPEASKAAFTIKQIREYINL